MAETTATPTAAKTPRKRAIAKASAANGAASKPSVKTGVVAKAKETTTKLAKEATTAARNAANEGKDRASDALTSVSNAVAGAASLVEEKVGAGYGQYARKAADKVSDVAQTLHDKDIDDLVDDTRQFIRKQPMIALGAAVAVGFVLTRLFKIGASATDDNTRA